MIALLLSLSVFATEPSQQHLKELTGICESKIARDLPGKITSCKIELSKKLAKPFSGVCTGRLRKGVSCKITIVTHDEGSGELTTVCILTKDSGLWSIHEKESVSVNSYEPEYEISSIKGKQTGHATFSRPEETITHIESQELDFLSLRNATTDPYKMKQSAKIQIKQRGTDEFLDLKRVECFFSDL